MEVAGDSMLELEHASIIEESSMHVVTLDSLTRQKLLELPTPKVSMPRTGVKSIRMEQIILLEKYGSL